jgi:heme oxygenase
MTEDTMFQGNPLRDNLLFERLHQATCLAHQRLEHRVDICYPNFDVHDYRRLLQDFWGFYQPLERKLVVLADHILPSPYSQQRRKAPRLKQDLLSLGMTEVEIAGLPLCGRLPAIPSLPRAFGVLYAIEGATVGERIADMHLLEQLRIDPSRGGSFFSSLNASYDPFLNSYWQEFIAVSESVEEPGPQLHAIEAAADALDCLEAWLDYRHRPKPANFSHWKPQSEPHPFRVPQLVDSICSAT